MAGIGFKLKKLIEKGNLIDSCVAYFHAIMISSGPWLITVLFLSFFYLVFSHFVSVEEINRFRSVIIYNFCFTLVLSSPVVAISTRFLADCIYSQDLTPVPGMLFGSLMIYTVTGFPLASLFYSTILNESPTIIILSIINFMLILYLWQTILFLTTIKHYTIISTSFLTGFFSPILLYFFLSDAFSVSTFLITFNIGIALILASFFSLIFKQFPGKIINYFQFFTYFKKYRDLACAGLFYNMAIWVDKWIMWSAPDATILPNHLIMYPPYDSAMFIAFLNVIPALGMFLLTQETRFYEKYVEYIQGIQKNANFSKIQEYKKELIKVVFQSSRNFILLQCAVALITIFMAPSLFQTLGINYIQLGMFRFGVLGSSLQILMLFATIVLSYFDERRSVLMISFFFFALNALFTYASLKLGFSFYGYGYFLSTLLSFAIAAIVLERYLHKLVYHTFVTNNPSIPK